MLIDTTLYIKWLSKVGLWEIIVKEGGLLESGCLQQKPGIGGLLEKVCVLIEEVGTGFKWEKFPI